MNKHGKCKNCGDLKELEKGICFGCFISADYKKHHSSAQAISEMEQEYHGTTFVGKGAARLLGMEPLEKVEELVEPTSNPRELIEGWVEKLTNSSIWRLYQMTYGELVARPEDVFSAVEILLHQQAQKSYQEGRQKGIEEALQVAQDCDITYECEAIRELLNQDKE